MSSVDLDKKTITYKMAGKSFDNGFDLNDTIVSLKHFQNILDKAYLTIENKERISKADREVFKVKATDIREGSFIAELALYTGAAIQIAYPIINTYYPSLLLDVTKQGFEYLKTVLKANKEGNKITVSHTGEGDTMILNIEGNNNGPIYIGSNVYTFAARAYDDIRNLASMIDGENIKQIDIVEKIENQKIMKLGQREKELFKSQSRLDEEPIIITGKIFRIDIRAKSGKMLIIDSSDEDLAKGEMNFEIMMEEDIKKCCSVIDKEVKFSALKKIQYDPIELSDKVKSLKIVRVS